MMPIFLALTGPLPARRNRQRQAVALALVIVIFAVAADLLTTRTWTCRRSRRPAAAGAGGANCSPKADDPSQQVTRTSPCAAGYAAAGRSRRDRATMLSAAGRRAADFLEIAAVIVAVMVAVWIVLRFSGGIVKILRPAASRCSPGSPVCCWPPSPCSSSPTRSPPS
jgi:multiple antibiotic resistance protein